MRCRAQRFQLPQLFPVRARRAEPAQGAAQDRGMGRGRQAQEVPEGPGNVALCQEGVGLLRQIIALDLRGLGVAGGGQGEPGIGLLQRRDPMQPKGVARGVGQGVGGVLPPGQPAGVEKVDQLRLAQAQQGPDQIAGPRPHAADALGTGAPGQVHQHGLGLVVQVVSQGDHVRAHLRLDGPQPTVAQPPGAGLQAFAGAPCLTGHVHAGFMEGDGEPPAQVPAEGRVPGALRPDGVIHVGGEQLKVQGAPRFGQHRRQRHGVRPAGQRDQHPPTPQAGQIRRRVPSHHTSLHHNRYYYNRFEK